MVVVVKTDLDLARLARDLLRADLLPLQIVGDMHVHRELFVGQAFVVDVLPVILPQIAAFARFGHLLISLGILDLPKV